MADSEAGTGQAAALHRQAVATLEAAVAVLGPPTPAPDLHEQYRLAETLRAAAHELTPGWLGASLAAQAPTTPLGGACVPRFVRVGTARPLDDATFPAIVPLLGVGHLTVDADARDARVAGLLRCLLLRLLASTPVGSLLVRTVDGTGGGKLFAPFAALADAGLMSPPAVDRAALRAVLTEAEQWLRPVRGATPRRGRPERLLLVVIASLPELTEGGDLVRIAALAQQGPESGLHLVVAGWPPPPLTAETVQAPLPRTTMVSLRNPHAVVGDPPGDTYAAPERADAPPSGWLNAPVFLDEDPPAALIEAVCRELVAQSAVASHLTLANLLGEPAEQWSADASDGLATTVGHDGDTPVTLLLNDLTPHWMIAGRPGAGRSAFLINVLYGLGSRYSPGELALYLLSCREGAAFAEFVPMPRNRSWLPHTRAVGMECDREYGLAVLRELDAEMNRRSVAYKRAGVTRFAELRAAATEEGRRTLPRILCVIDEFPVLFAGADATATAAVALLESLARKGRSYGIHLILAGHDVRGVEVLHGPRDSVFGQFPVRIALPGGGDVLEAANDSAAGLPLGTAVVNTAGGLGGPRGATRGHERTVQFPDPHADPDVLHEVRQRLWESRDPEAPAPRVFAGYAAQYLAEDPTYRAALAGRSGRPTALVGRVVDVGLSTAGFAFDASPGRHLAVFGSQAGAQLLDAAARSVAVQHAPGTARFVVCSLVAEGDPIAAALVAELSRYQECVPVDAGGLAAELDPQRPGYRVVFGMDAAGTSILPAADLGRLLHDGPGRGVHVLSWWRGLRRFLDEADGDGWREGVAGLVLLDVSGQDVSQLLGRAVDWRPRTHRALLHDRHADRTDVIVPFRQPEDGP